MAYIDIEQQGKRKKQEYIILISLSLIHTNKKINFLSHSLPPLPSTSIFPPILYNNNNYKQHDEKFYEMKQKKNELQYIIKIRI